MLRVGYRYLDRLLIQKAGLEGTYLLSESRTHWKETAARGQGMLKALIGRRVSTPSTRPSPSVFLWSAACPTQPALRDDATLQDATARTDESAPVKGILVTPGRSHDPFFSQRFFFLPHCLSPDQYPTAYRVLYCRAQPFTLRNISVVDRIS